MEKTKNNSNNINDVFNKKQVRENISIKIKPDHSIVGTKSIVGIVYVGKNPIYALKKYQKDPKDLSGENGVEERYNLEKIILTAVPRSELGVSLNGIKIRAMPKIKNAIDEEMTLYLSYVNQKSLDENLKKAKTFGERLDLLNYSLSSLAFLHHQLYEHKEDIENKIELKKITADKITEKILKYMGILYNPEKDPSSSKKLERIFQKKAENLEQSSYVPIHYHFYSQHIRLDDKEVINLDMGGIRSGPIEIDIGCLLGDVYHFFKEDPIDIFPASIEIYNEKMGKIEEKCGATFQKYQLSDEKIRFASLFTNLRKAAGITFRKRTDELDEATHLIETIKTQVGILKKEYGGEYTPIHKELLKIS